MLEMITGCSVPAADRLFEEYAVKEWGFEANISAGKIHEVFEHFLAVQEGSLFFIMELPTKADVEETLRKSDSDPMHVDIYYIDGLTREEALAILFRYGELLINDGLVRFGFGVHDNSAELMKMNYNILTLWTTDSEAYRDFFEAQDVPHTENLVTAWDTFSAETPGKSRKIEINGMDVYSLPEELSDWGIYFAERREE